MSTGTITELSPQDGLGWITLETGARVRFGATACKGFVPAVGTKVNVMETAPGYGGVTKATHVVQIAAAKPVLKRIEARSSRAKLDALNVPFDDALRTIVARADSDDAFFADLEHLGFELKPMAAREIDCESHGFSVVAMNGGGSAYGVYVGEGAPDVPWVFWDHEIDRLAYLAPDTAGFFAAYLAWCEQSLKDPSPAHRVRAAIAELGVLLPPINGDVEYFLEGTPVRWLPRGPLTR